MGIFFESTKEKGCYTKVQKSRIEIMITKLTNISEQLSKGELKVDSYTVKNILSDSLKIIREELDDNAPKTEN